MYPYMIIRTIFVCIYVRKCMCTADEYIYVYHLCLYKAVAAIAHCNISQPRGCVLASETGMLVCAGAALSGPCRFWSSSLAPRLVPEGLRHVEDATREEVVSGTTRAAMSGYIKGEY